MQKKLFFCFCNGNLAEFLEILHQLKSGFAGARAGSFVTFDDLSLSIDLECLNVGVDFFNKCFHKNKILNCFGVKV